MILPRGRSDEQGIKLSWAELQAGAGCWLVERSCEYRRLEIAKGENQSHCLRRPGDCIGMFIYYGAPTATVTAKYFLVATFAKLKKAVITKLSPWEGNLLV